MSVSLVKTWKKDAKVTVFAINSKTTKTQLPDYLSPDQVAALSPLLGKQPSIRSYCVTSATSKTVSNAIACAVGSKDWSNYQLSLWVQEVYKSLRSINAKTAVLDVDSLEKATGKPIVIGELCQLLLHYQYQFTRYKSGDKKTTDISIQLYSSKPAKDSAAQLAVAAAIDGGKKLARDLGNMPANDCTIDYFVSTAKKLAKDRKLALKILDEKDMRKLNMGAFLSVTRASTQQGRILIMEYRGGGKAPFHALVGKGLTFDSGGISLKPPAGMEEMKFDMCGAASVFGACQAILTLKPKINVLFVIAAAENMIAGDASRPGDIVSTHEGHTVEILNTDAEGRLVLCDTISYIKKQYKPKSIVDIATLTGACVIALGHHASALYSNDDALSAALQTAADTSQDHVWPMPLWQQYQDQLSSNVADIPNIGGRDGGSITAACFLSRFAENVSWAHLDIAGTGWVSGKNKAATGRPTALLTHYLLQNA